MEDNVGISAGTQESHVSASTDKAAGRDTERINAQPKVEGSGIVSKYGGNAHGHDGSWFAWSKKLR
jgi:hypothetical protein